MSITGKELFAWVENECPTTCECSMRTSISRNYYAAYHEAKRYHDSLPLPGMLPSKAGGIHAELANRLTFPAPEIKDESIRRQSQDMGRFLKVLHQLRIRADYEIDEDITIDVVQQAQSMARRIIS